MRPGALLLTAALALALGIVIGPRFRRTWLATTLLAAAAGFAAAGWVLTGHAALDWRSDFLVAGEALHVRLDGVSALFLALLAVLAAAGAVYAHEYWSDRAYPQSAPGGRRWWSGLALSVGWVLVTSNGLHFLIGWELFTVCAYFLVTLDRQRVAVRAAGWLYLVASHAGTVCLFAFFATLAARTGSWELGPMHGRTALAPLFWLVLAGFGVKAGVFPLHVWLPSAHANAPSHVSAMLSGMAVKVGLYGIVRFSGWLPLPPAAGWVVLSLGAVGAVLGMGFAVAQTDLKRLLAYCTVENIGIILVGLGAALLAATHGNSPWGRLALAGALLHIWNHGLMKSLLFLGAGSVLHATGTREMSRLGGLWRRMPWTAALFAFGAIAISGLPPLNGFVGEWLVYLGLFDAVNSRDPAAWAAMPAVIMVAAAGALALATFVKASATIFLGAARTQPAARAHESGPWMRAPMLLLAAGSAALGLAPVLFWPAISRAVGVWQPAWVATDLPAPLTTLGPVQVALAGLSVLAAAGLWRAVRSAPVRRALTWDCGYAAPIPRMQYTAASFSGLPAGWFFWLLQPARRLRRPRGPFPADALLLERLPETVLERVIGPVAAAVLRASSAARRLQHGRLQFYIAYVVAGLAALAALVLWGNPT